jgi:hypothetical protein
MKKISFGYSKKNSLIKINKIMLDICNNNSIINFLDIRDLIKKNNKNEAIFSNFFYTKNDFAIIIINKAMWETLILKKKCVKITDVFFSNNTIGEKVLNQVIKFIKKNNIFWVQFDSNSSPPFLENLFIKNGFEISNRYLVWKSSITDLDLNFIKNQSSKRLVIKTAYRKDVKKIQSFSKCYPLPGRFVLNDKFYNNGIKLYSSWIKNSILDKNQKTFFYELNNIIHAYQNILVNKKEQTLVLGLLRNSQKIPSLGVHILINSLNYGISKKLKYFMTRSSTFNQDINSINQKLGMKIISSGMNLDYFNKNYLR